MLAALVISVLHQAPLVTELKCAGFSVITTSPSGDPLNDDERFEISVEGARFPVPFKPTMFTGAGARGTAAQLKCSEHLLAWEVRPGVLVLVVSRSGRPQLDLVSLALVDLAKKKTLQVIDTPYELSSGRAQTKQGVTFSFVTRAAPGGFDLRVVREWLPDDDSPSGALEDWLAVRAVKEKLTAGWLRP